nr:MAG TPA: hypothetical protein [Caudoviricetes sp.]
MLTPAMRNPVHTRPHAHPSSSWLRRRATLGPWL